MGWVCLQVTGWHACLAPTLPFHHCIHRCHGCDRTARRAHRLRSACGRISPQSRSCSSQEGRRRRCQSCYHTFRKCTDMLREKEKGHSGLGDKLSSGHMGHRGSPPSSTPISSLLSGQNWWLSLGRLWEHLVPVPGQLSERRARPRYCCVCLRVRCSGRGSVMNERGQGTQFSPTSCWRV